MNFGETIKYLLIDSGKSQQDLANAIGFSQRAISKWVNNQAEPTERAIISCAKFFSVSADYLLGLEDELGGSSSDYGALQLSAEELKLLEDFRALTEPGKKLVKTTIETFLETYRDERRRKRTS